MMSPEAHDSNDYDYLKIFFLGELPQASMRSGGIDVIENSAMNKVVGQGEVVATFDKEKKRASSRLMRKRRVVGIALIVTDDALRQFRAVRCSAGAVVRSCAHAIIL